MAVDGNQDVLDTNSAALERRAARHDLGHAQALRACGQADTWGRGGQEKCARTGQAGSPCRRRERERIWGELSQPCCAPRHLVAWQPASHGAPRVARDALGQEEHARALLQRAEPRGRLAPGIIGQMCLRPSLHAPPHPPRAGRPDAPCLLFLMHIEGTCQVQLSRPRAHAAPAGTARAPAYRVMPAATHDPATRGPAPAHAPMPAGAMSAAGWVLLSLSLVLSFTFHSTPPVRACAHVP